MKGDRYKARTSQSHEKVLRDVSCLRHFASDSIGMVTFGGPLYLVLVDTSKGAGILYKRPNPIIFGADTSNLRS